MQALMMLGPNCDKQIARSRSTWVNIGERGDLTEKAPEEDKGPTITPARHSRPICPETRRITIFDIDSS